MKKIICGNSEVTYIVFTPDEACRPDLHEGPFHFEPEGWGEGEPFSPGYATSFAAEKAARLHQDEVESETLLKGVD